MGSDERTRDRHVEPLFEALQKGPAVNRRLVWKLFWVGLLLIGLLVLVIQQSY
ncbi:MAG: hypothetical protein ACKVXR_03100 [Planctomycetota bacterium]